MMALFPESYMTVDLARFRKSISQLEKQVKELRRIAEDATANGTVADANAVITRVLGLGILCPRPDRVAAYLWIYHDVHDIVIGFADALICEFRGERAEIELDLYGDPEIDDEYLTFLVHVPEYSEVFDWRDYLNLARSLGGGAIGASVTLVVGDAAHRSAVSRAYYAAFGHARSYAIRHLAFIPTNTPRDHGRLRTHLQSRGMPAVSRRLDRLRRSRNLCDYEDAAPNLPGMVQRALGDAAFIISQM